MSEIMSIFVGATLCGRPLRMLNARKLRVWGCKGAAE